MCAHAVRVAVQELPGVQDVEVSLNEGTVRLRLEAGNTLTLSRLRQVIRERGFSPQEAEVRVSGRLEERGEELSIRLPGSGVSLTVHAPDDVLGRLKSRTGEDVALEGVVAKDEDGVTPRVLEVRQVSEP